MGTIKQKAKITFNARTRNNERGKALLEKLKTSNRTKRVVTRGR